MTANNTQNHAATHAIPPRYDGSSTEYHHWRDHRLTLEQVRPAPLQHGIRLTPAINTSEDRHALATLCNTVRDYGFCHYQWTDTPDNLSDSINRLNHCLGLTVTDNGVITDANALSVLQDLEGTEQGRFIPYTSRAMNWHTDGYYNTREQSVRCFTLHCVQPAQSGGELMLMDTGLLLIRLYDLNPGIVALLWHPQAMTLPGNSDKLGHHRPDRTAPLFFTHDDGTLGTNFTTRSRHIEWRDEATRQAAATAKECIDLSADCHHCIRLTRFQGIVTRNILHARRAFTDPPKSRENSNSNNTRYGSTRGHVNLDQSRIENSSSSSGRQMLRGRYHQLAQLNPQAFSVTADAGNITASEAEITRATNHVTR
ncbi:hypothetical protein AB833_08635 [Chromatiales bacterium (ex Bugula neritina AB1)]|nr:hypothetical protein AB833_08635 [Chromatiales bacterium (ex Bugula neritina AB1)]